jgi:predicted kinase
LGRAAMTVLFEQTRAVLAVGGEVIAEANFDRELSRDQFLGVLAEAPASVVRVVLQCEPAVLTGRFRSRAESGERHPGHLDAVVLDRLVELVRTPYEPPELPGPVIEVDATDLNGVDFDAVTARVLVAFA